MQVDPDTPVVLAIGGHDPTGGAGIIADSQAIAAQGCHPLTLVTALTAQDTRGAQAFWPVAPAQFRQQASLLLDDIPVAAIKLGMLATPGMVECVANLLVAWPGVPVVLDPVLAAGGGGTLQRDGLLAAITGQLLSHCHLVTPNTDESEALTGSRDPDAAARRLARDGVDAVLITGTHAPGDTVINRLYRQGEPVQARAWPRLEGEFHGSGCTLASAIAALLARGHELEAAVDTAQAYTWQALADAFRPGHGQAIPGRTRGPD